MIRKLFVILILLYTAIKADAQYVPALTDDHLETFLLELESDNFLNLNTSGYSHLSERNLYLTLKDAELNSRLMNLRQKKELGFYLRQFRTSSDNNSWEEHDVDIFRSRNSSLSINPPGYYFRNRNAGFVVIPQFGSMFTLNTIEKSLKYHYGARVSGNIGYFGYYAGFKKYEQAPYTYEKYFESLVPDNGFAYTNSYSLNAGISFENEYFSGGVLIDNQRVFPLKTRNSYFNSHTPSYPMIFTAVHPSKWISYEFKTGYILPYATSLDYFTKSGEKSSFAQNQITIKPVPLLNFTVGQMGFKKSTTYNALYLLPLNIYTGNSNSENSFLYYQINLALIRHLKITFSHIIDDFKYSRVQSDYDKNVHSYNIETSLSNWPVPQTIFTFYYNVQSPLFYNHKVSPVYNLFPDVNSNPIDNRTLLGIDLDIKPTFNLLIKTSYKLENVGQSGDYSGTYPYEFELISPRKRQSHIFSFEFTLKPAYYSSIFAGIHFINHTGDEPDLNLPEYNDDVDFFFRLGIIIGL